MANSAGFLKESIWRDPDWRLLPRTAQATYAQLLSQKELDRAGMLPLQVSKWAKGCSEITEADLWRDLKLLEERRFIFVDEDADEVFIRSYMRHTEVTKYPQYRKAAIRCAGMVASPKLRHELAIELRKLRHADTAQLADEIDPGGTIPEPSTNPSATVPEGCLNGSETVKGSRTVREPSRVGERVGVVTSVGGSVGETRAHEANTDQTQPGPDLNDPPPEYCSKHPGGTDKPCHGCGAAREHRQRWEAEQAKADADRRTAFSREVANCPDCDEHGWVDTGNAVTRCTNHDWETAHV